MPTLFKRVGRYMAYCLDKTSINSSNWAFFKVRLEVILAFSRAFSVVFPHAITLACSGSLLTCKKASRLLGLVKTYTSDSGTTLGLSSVL